MKRPEMCGKCVEDVVACLVGVYLSVWSSPNLRSGEKFSVLPFPVDSSSGHGGYPGQIRIVMDCAGSPFSVLSCERKGKQGKGGCGEEFDVLLSCALDSTGEMDMAKRTVCGTRYANILFRLDCAPVLIQSGFFPNFKEFCESMVVYRALSCLGSEVLKNDFIHFVIGDGQHPRTGMVLSYLTKHMVVSVDPLANLEKFESVKEKFGVQRLEFLKTKFTGDVMWNHIGGYENVIFVLPHSHWPPDGGLVKKIASDRRIKTFVIIALPCCVDYVEGFGRIPDLSYVNYNIPSEKREIQIFVLKNNKGLVNIERRGKN